MLFPFLFSFSFDLIVEYHCGINKLVLRHSNKFSLYEGKSSFAGGQVSVISGVHETTLQKSHLQHLSLMALYMMLWYFEGVEMVTAEFAVCSFIL